MYYVRIHGYLTSSLIGNHSAFYYILKLWEPLINLLPHVTSQPQTMRVLKKPLLAHPPLDSHQFKDGGYSEYTFCHQQRWNNWLRGKMAHTLWSKEIRPQVLGNKRKILTVIMSLHNLHKILSRANEQTRNMNSESLSNLPKVIYTHN